MHWKGPGQSSFHLPPGRGPGGPARDAQRRQQFTASRRPRSWRREVHQHEVWRHGAAGLRRRDGADPAHGIGQRGQRRVEVALALQRHRDPVPAREQRAVRHAQGVHLEGGGVHRVDGGGPCQGKDVVRQHGVGARGALLRGLEHEQHGAGQFAPHRRERRGQCHAEGGVDVMPAEMPDPRRQRGERDRIGLVRRHRVQVRPERHHRARPRPTEQRHHALAADTGPHLEAECPEPLGHPGRGPRLSAGELRVLVQVAAEGDQLRHGRRQHRRHAGEEGVGRGPRPRRRREEREAEHEQGRQRAAHRLPGDGDAGGTPGGGEGFRQGSLARVRAVGRKCSRLGSSAGVR